MKYLHNGFIPGVPARDLSEDEVKQYGKKRLLDSGCYQEVRKAYVKKSSEPVIEQAEE